MPIPSALNTHLQGEQISIAYLWKVTLLSGVVKGFTSHDKDIVYLGVTYKASTGFTPSSTAKSGDMSADSLDVTGPFGDDSATDITRMELFAGLYRGASLTIMVVNYASIADGAYTLFRGEIGEVRDLGDVFSFEVRSFDHKLRQVIGITVQPLCDAEFADSRCGLVAGDFTVTGEVTAVTSGAVFTDSTTAGITAKDSDYFGAGKLEWLTGDNEGVVMDVKAFDAGQFTLYESMPAAIQVGDTFSVIAGCRKRRTEDCKTKFDNVVNHRGFPDVPGDRFMTTYAQPK